MSSSPKGRRLSATTVVRSTRNSNRRSKSYSSIDLKQQQKDEIYHERYYNLWLTSMEVWIHQLLYVRKLYPSAAFRPSFSPFKSMTMTKYYHCQHPSTTNYIRDVLTNVILPTIFFEQQQQHQRSADEKDTNVADSINTDSNSQNDDYDDNDEIVLELYEPAKSGSSSSSSASASASASAPEIVYEQYFLTLSRKLHATKTQQQQQQLSSSTTPIATSTATSSTTAAMTARKQMITIEYLDLLETKLRDLIVCGIGKLDTVEHHPSYTTSNTMTFRILLRRRRPRRCSWSYSSTNTQQQCTNETSSNNSKELQDALSTGKWCYHTSTECGNNRNSGTKSNDTTTTTTTTIDDKSSSVQRQQKHEKQASQQQQQQQPQRQLRKRILFSSPTMGFHFFYRCLPSTDKDQEQQENEQEKEEEEKETESQPIKKKVRIAL